MEYILTMHKKGKAALHKIGKANTLKKHNTFAQKAHQLCTKSTSAMHKKGKAAIQEICKGAKSEKNTLKAIPVQGMIEIDALHKIDRHIDNKIIIIDNLNKIICKRSSIKDSCCCVCEKNNTHNFSDF